jgi:hypothetical protein
VSGSVWYSILMSMTLRAGSQRSPSRRDHLAYLNQYSGCLQVFRGNGILGGGVFRGGDGRWVDGRYSNGVCFSDELG